MPVAKSPGCGESRSKGGIGGLLFSLPHLASLGYAGKGVFSGLSVISEWDFDLCKIHVSLSLISWTKANIVCGDDGFPPKLRVTIVITVFEGPCGHCFG